MRLKILIAVVVVSGAIATGQARPAKESNRTELAVQRQGLAFAQKHCSACHAIDTGISPKPEAPSFEAIINTRSEEHTSELQSLMRISYAVFCLKKQKKVEESDNTSRELVDQSMNH